MKAALLGAWLLSTTALAHVGSPDLFHEGGAGPYTLLVTVRPPEVVPGVAEVQLRVLGGEAREIHLVPVPLEEGGARFAPTPDLAVRDRQDAAFFTGHLWLMATGSWEVRVTVDGAQGKGVLSVPVSSLPLRVSGMQPALGAVLAGLLLLLCAGMVSIVGAASRESRLEPGLSPGAADQRRAWKAMGLATVLVLLVVLGGGSWWSARARQYAGYVFKPLQMQASVADGARLKLELSDPGWLAERKMDDFLPDHGHPMHLFAVRWPALDRVLHLHPEPLEGTTFAHDLPTVSAGTYRLFGDVVHRDGLPETLTAKVALPELTGRAFQGDDAGGEAPAAFDASRTEVPLSGGGRMVWLRDEAPLKARQATRFRFRVDDAAGQPATDLELYMGMVGHAAFMKTDGSVFAHVHPSGSIPMAALDAVARVNGVVDPQAGHVMPKAALPAEVAFPFGLPAAGDYRIFVQVKRAGRVETAAFDARAVE